jgi:hypothetical protein
VTVARADVDDERIRRGRRARQRFAETRINRLSNEVLDDSPMWCINSSSHKVDVRILALFQSKSINILQNLSTSARL